MQSKPTEMIIDASDALRLRSTYEEDTSTPELIETHISHIYLTDRFAYKLKKPVKFDFLDYSTVDLRHQACKEEIRVNRRLAPDVYIGAFPIGRDETGTWRIGLDLAEKRSKIDPEDWLVKMQRLSDERCLRRMLQSETQTDGDADHVVDMLGQFYRSLPSVDDTKYANRFRQHIRENLRSLQAPEHDVPQPTVQRIHSAQLQFLLVHSDEIQRRVSDGHVVEGHGDLRAEHIYMTEPPVCIDGIEFSRELRIVDVADELSFLLVTCELLDAAEFGKQVMMGVFKTLGDEPPRRLLEFYCSYRAAVRAKVAALRIAQSTGNAESTAENQLQQFLTVADQHACQLDPPRAVLVRGLSGTGKTTFAEQLATQLAFEHLSTDKRRKTTNDDESPASGAISYSDEARARVYESILNEACELVDQHLSVILDGTFLSSGLIDRFTNKLRQHGAAVSIATCVCPAEIAIERINKRSKEKSWSDADPAVFAQQLQSAEPVPDSIPSIAIDSTRPFDHMVEQLAEHWRSVAIGVT